jgi:putative addiction module component (TIGR02574 family)
MTRLQMAELHKLSVKDKIKVVQTLWNDIAKKQSLDTLPVEHKKILDQRIQLIDSGKANFKSWTEIQNKFQKLL